MIRGGKACIKVRRRLCLLSSPSCPIALHGKAAAAEARLAPNAVVVVEMHPLNCNATTQWPIFVKTGREWPWLQNYAQHDSSCNFTKIAAAAAKSCWAIDKGTLNSKEHMIRDQTNLSSFVVRQERAWLNTTAAWSLIPVTKILTRATGFFMGSIRSHAASFEEIKLATAYSHLKSNRVQSNSNWCTEQDKLGLVKCKQANWAIN